jgi:hypothetical protein
MNNFKKKINKIWNNKCLNYDKLPSTLPAVDRIIVIGDIHGDLSQLIKSLKIGKVINNNLDWIGEDTVVVQVGDQIDSCRYNGKIHCNNIGGTSNDNAEDIKILKFMTILHKKAKEYNGAVYSLMGNHELLNVMGDMTYVSYENIKEFTNYRTKNNSIINDPVEGRKHAFTPGNDMANFLGCTRQMALIIGSNLFVHAGIVPQISKKYKVEDLNNILSLYLFDELNNPTHFHDVFMSAEISPLWNRTFGSLNQSYDNCKYYMEPLKTAYKVGKIYVGHTPQLKDGIHSSCDNKIWKVDGGMSRAFDTFKNSKDNNKAQVLEILNDGESFNILN